MKKFFTLLFCAVSVSHLHSQIGISQIYGGGASGGATYKYDYIELYNAGTSSVSLNSYSVQYSSASGTTWSKTNLAGMIPARSYFLIQEAGTTSTGMELPTPDVTGTIAMNATVGKVALTNSQTALSGACPTTDASLVDLVGYGGTANCYLGTGPTTAPSVTNSVFRDPTTYSTTNNNASFTAAAANPRNSAQILPLQLLSFSATPKESTVAFAWKTVNERNTRNFEIEQSFDGSNFKSIATVAAAGNTTTEKSYSYTGTLNTTATYYRLKMVDADGKSTTSSVVKVAPSKTGFSLGNVYPIPAKNSVTVEWNSRTSGATTLILTDMSGRTVRTLNLQSAQGFNQYQLDMNTLSVGQYFLRLKNDVNQIQTIVTKQ